MNLNKCMLFKEEFWNLSEKSVITTLIHYHHKKLQNPKNKKPNQPNPEVGKIDYLENFKVKCEERFPNTVYRCIRNVFLSSVL